MAKPAMSASEEQKGRRGRAEEAAVIGEAARPELRPREAVADLRVADALRSIPRAVVGLRDALRAVERPVDLRRIRTEVHVVPEVAVGDDVQDARARHAGEQHGETEVHDDVGIQADPPRPEDAERGREQEA
jgi:hypothetical protein